MQCVQGLAESIRVARVGEGERRVVGLAELVPLTRGPLPVAADLPPIQLVRLGRGFDEKSRASAPARELAQERRLAALDRESESLLGLFGDRVSPALEPRDLGARRCGGSYPVRISHAGRELGGVIE